ncbi:MAG: phage/plasmid primase, P4 family [Deltaproteobacteria bacterium]|nr:phage/plasmid primase, P4 family [Myxococcales bacterium]MDP3220941.1 phage/plasmid primase, P4 family [Deltaproteobacteria bacterium]
MNAPRTPPAMPRTKKDPWEGLAMEAQAGALTAKGWPGISHAHGDVRLQLGAVVALAVGGPAAMAALEALQRTYGELPKAPCWTEGSGRRVILFGHPTVLDATTGHRALAPRLRAAPNLFGAAPGAALLTTGDELLPGSHSDVWRRWKDTAHPATTDLPELPGWLADLVREPHKAHEARARHDDEHEPIACTDVGNAERLAARHGADIRWCETWGHWLAWDGKHWKRDDSGEVTRRAVDAVRMIGAEASRCTREDDRKRLLAHAIKSESAGKITAMLQLLKAQPGISVGPEAFDTNPWLLNCANGSIDLRDGTLHPHLRADLCTKYSPVAFRPGAARPVFNAFLAKVQPDPEVRAYLQRLAGYAATGTIRDHVLPIHYGTGGNGKGAFTNALLHALGTYASQVPNDLLMAKEREAHPTDKATLRGLRFASCSETGKGKALDEAQVKLLTGGDPISARVMHGDFFTFFPTHTLWLSTNNRPRIRETSNGIWRRVALIPWTVEIPEAEQDHALGDKLRAEEEGVLDFIVEGAALWFRDGLRPPHAVQVATQEYRAESDWLTEYLSATCTKEPERPGGVAPMVLAGALYKAYQAWCEKAGKDPVSQTAFGRTMADVGWEKKNRAGYPWYLGLRLLSDLELRDQLTREEGSCDEE